MKLDNDARILIRNAYPGRGDLIDLGLRDNPAFRELCEDYCSCAIALEKWRGTPGSTYLERVQEYEELLAELVKEIEDWLENLSQGMAQSEDAVPE